MSLKSAFIKCLLCARHKALFPIRGEVTSSLEGGFGSSWLLRQPAFSSLGTCMLVFAVVSDSLRPPWTVGHQAPVSMAFPRQEHWMGLSFPTLECLPDPGIETVSLVSPALAGRFFLTEPPGKPVGPCVPHFI